MKRNIFKALAVVAALALSSCSMFITVEKGDNSTESKETYITIGLNQAARTALPTVSSENDFTSFTLTSKESIGSRLLGTWTSDDTSSAYAKMNAAKIAVTAGSTYTFTLQAVKGGAKWEGSVTKTIETGGNSLSFTLAVASLSTEGTGAINVTLTVPDKVKVVDVELKTMDESQTVAPTDAALTFADGKAAYTASDIPAGNYVLVYTLYGDTQKTLKLGEWREYAGIADGLTSSSNPVIENDADLAHIYKITLNLNGGTFTGTFPGSYTRYSFDEDNEINLPYSAIRSDYISLNEDGEVELYKKNCFFEGWYDAETDGEIVYCIEPSMGDVTLWAYWTDTLTLDRIDAVYKNRGIDALKNYLNLQPLLEKGFDHINLKLTNMADGITPHSNGYDDWTDERFTAIVGAISSVPDFSVNLDLSETSLTFIPCSAFFDNSKLKNLTGITLPKTLTEIIQNAFANTSFTKITIPANVEEIGRFAFEDSELEEITFEKDSELESISLKAFYGSKITSITLPASLMIIHDSAFEACDKLETINYEGTAEMWAQIYRSADWHKGIKATTVKCSDYTVPLDLSPADFEGLIGTKPASIAKEVGDIVFSDGSAIPYTEDLELTETQKDNAVAVIFYKGTGLNNGNDKTTCRTLGVGFNINNDGLEWCSCNANAYELSIDTIKCRPKDSNYWCLLFSDATANDKNGSDNLEQIAEFLTANEKDDDTDDSSNYPAFYFAKNYDAPGSAFDRGWYLPSLAEFNELIYAIFTDTDIDINYVLRLVINEEAPINYCDNNYWTSTQSSDDVIEAYSIYKERGTIYYANEEKSYTCCTCAIREF